MLRLAGVIVIAVGVLGVSACSPLAPTATPTRSHASSPITATLAPATYSPRTSTPSIVPDGSPVASLEPRTVGWRHDLQRLVPEMNVLHPDLAHGVSISELENAVSVLSGRVPELTDDELMIHVLGIVAMVSRQGCDGHTGAFVWGNGTYPVDSLPLRLWLFEDAVYIVDALPPYEALIGGRIETIGGHSVDAVMGDIDPIVPRDNNQTVRLLMPRFLLIPQILRGLGLIPTAGPVTLGIGGDAGQETVDVNPIPMAEYNAWAGPYGLHLPVDPAVPYLSRIDDALWVQGPDEDGLAYVQYNRVDLVSLVDVTTALADADTRTVILDVRHNYGGEVSALEPVIDAFGAFATGHPKSLYLITGRNTFSAGSMLVARLDAETDAVIVGEPMGGCPTAWGNSRDFELPHSGIVVSVSTFFEIGVDPDDTRLTVDPDIPATLTPDEWADGGDPALEQIRGQLE